MFRDVARSTNCGVLLVHHTSKPPQGASDGHVGNMYSARGASSLVGVARNVQTLFWMSQHDADQYGVADPERHLYLRLDDAKSNLSLIDPDPLWFCRKTVLIPNDEEVGLLVPHRFDQRATNAFSLETAIKILRLIDERWKSGNAFSESANSARYVVNAMAQFGLQKKSSKRLLADWIASGMVASEVMDKRNGTRGLRVLKWPG